ncbi:ABC transporter ATP-binding protein [Rapidithrix thailandica]|uniref:ABC transporter ATP-binding protein n=1 Tax=Rapidithrix thailandica TaxID=413964 RepID=A0AAW9SE73_9BACT
MEPVLNAHRLTKTYRTGSESVVVLQDVSFHVYPGESVAIIGASGSGKTTLLNLLAGLDLPDQGEIFLGPTQLNQLTENDRAYMRNRYIGLVYQDYQLLPHYTALENVLFPLEILRQTSGKKEKAQALLSKMGLSERYYHYPSMLSGGEQQRVAIARSIVTQPLILLADEPTGNLHREASDEITTLLFEMNKTLATPMVIVTHQMDLAMQCDRVYQMARGKLTPYIEKTLKPS